MIKCDACDGSGKILTKHAHSDGTSPFFAQRCSVCNGSGIDFYAEPDPNDAQEDVYDEFEGFQITEVP